jgi:hypothetical protein
LELNATPTKPKEKKAVFFGSAILLCGHCSGISQHTTKYFTFLPTPGGAARRMETFDAFKICTGGMRRKQNLYFL